MPADLTMGVDYTRVIFGQDARRVPVWMYVQDGGDATVSFVGGSRVAPGTPHPLRYGSTRTHQFLVGELIARPMVAVGTDTYRGLGLAGLATNGHDLNEMLGDGELVVPPRTGSLTAWMNGLLR